jgi:hypothetical protein
MFQKVDVKTKELNSKSKKEEEERVLFYDLSGCGFKPSTSPYPSKSKKP